ncbi:MAG: hypothetical protein IAG10_17660 [Planctomycetaceae bacterium]|nr:hypothetical protein [Planctomycetaceae bacterium]
MRKLSALTFAALLFGQLTTTWADPPAGRGNGLGASGSTLQRAVDSRAGLQQRATLRTQGSANGGTGVGVGGSGVGQNSANANGNVGVSADIQADANGSANAQSGTGRMPREVVTRRLQSLRNQQSAVVRNATRTELGIGIGNDSPSDTPTQSDKKPQPNNKPPRGKSGQGSNPNSNSNENPDSSNPAGLLSLKGSARSEIVAHGQNRLALTNADKLLAQRLARIDQMRDQALETDNDQLLDQADRMELLARMQFAERLAAGANDSSSQAGADAQGQATGAIRGRINRTTPPNPNQGVPADGSNDPDSDTNTGLLSGEAAAATQNEAAASLRNRVQRTQNGRRPTTPTAEPMPDQDTDGVTSQANAAAQNTTAASLSNKARRTNERTRRDTNPAEPAGKIRNASLSGQANSTNAADAAASNNSLNAAGTSATNAAANAQSK